MKLTSSLLPAVLLLTLIEFSSASLQSAAVNLGTIAYVRGGAEIRLVEPDADLWLMRLDGSDMRLLVKNGSGPSWGR